MEKYLPYILISVGSVIIIFLIFLALKARKSLSWEKASGILLEKGTRLIISKEIQTEDIQTRTIKWKSIHIDLKYEYEVDGIKYVSKRATFTDMVNKPISSLDKLLNEYLSNNNVVVYCNPKNHRDSVLFPGVKIWNFTPMITGILLIVAGIFFLNK